MGKNARKKKARAAQSSVDSPYRSWAVERNVLGGGESMLDTFGVVQDAVKGRGLVTTKGVKKGDVFLSINKELFITKDLAMSELPVSAVLQDRELMQGLYDNTDVALVLALLSEKQQESSRWGAHFSKMPESYDTVLSWAEEELAELRGSNVLKWAQRAREQVHADYQQLFPAAAEKHPSAFPRAVQADEYRWAVESVWSRAFDLDLVGGHPATSSSPSSSTSSSSDASVDAEAPADAPAGPPSPPQRTRCLVPFVDLLNHRADANVMHYFNPASACLEVLADESFAVGDELCLNYGPFPNSKLIQVYGFSLLGANPNPECVDVYVGTPPEVHDLLRLRNLDPAAPHTLVADRPFPFSLIEVCLLRREGQGNEVTAVQELIVALEGMIAEYGAEVRLWDDEDIQHENKRITWARSLCVAEIAVLQEHSLYLRNKLDELL